MQRLAGEDGDRVAATDEVTRFWNVDKFDAATGRPLGLRAVEPYVTVGRKGGGVERFERVPGDPDNRWQQVGEQVRVPQGPPISAADLLDRLKAVILDAEN